MDVTVQTVNSNERKTRVMVLKTKRTANTNILVLLYLDVSSKYWNTNPKDTATFENNSTTVDANLS